jgi:hypothetical protein
MKIHIINLFQFTPRGETPPPHRDETACFDTFDTADTECSTG